MHQTNTIIIRTVRQAYFEKVLIVVNSFVGVPNSVFIADLLPECTPIVPV